jgi:hypothetical protein
MAKLGINTGSSPNDGLGDSLLSAALKINQNFDEIYDTFGDGSSLNDYVDYAISAGISTNATNASNIGITTTDAIDILTSVVLVPNQSTGNQSPFIDSSLTYNAFSNTLSSPNFTGNLTGTATTALGISSNSDVFTSGIVTAIGGFISSNGTTPVSINIIGNKIVFSVSGIGSTSLTLFL